MFQEKAMLNELLSGTLARLAWCIILSYFSSSPSAVSRLRWSPPNREREKTFEENFTILCRLVQVFVCKSEDRATGRDGLRKFKDLFALDPAAY